MHVFVDGACTGNNRKNAHRRAGCGVYFSDTGEGFSIPLDRDFLEEFDLSTPTNQVAELAAVYWAARRIINGLNDDSENLYIYTDSSYAKSVFSEWVFDWKDNGWKKKTPPFDSPKNIELIKEVDRLLDTVNKRIKFVHVDAHRTAPNDRESKAYFLWFGNAEADRLARRATISSPTPQSRNTF